MNELLSQMNIVIFQAGNVVMTLGSLVASALVLTMGYWIARKIRIVIQKVLAPRFNIDRSIKVGDYIELSEGYRGSIEQIRVRSTIIRTMPDTIRTPVSL